MPNTSPSSGQSAKVHKRKGKKGSILLKLIASVLVVSFVAVGVAWYISYTDSESQRIMAETNTFYNNIFINDINVSGLTKEEATAKLNDMFVKPIAEKYITLDFDGIQLELSGIKTEIPFTDFGVAIDIDTAVETAYAYAREGEIKDRVDLIEALEKQPYHVDVDYTFDLATIEDILTPFVEMLYIAPVNATIERVSGRFVTTDEVVGRKMRYDEAYQEVLERVSGDNPGTVTVTTEVLAPEYTAESFKNATSLIGTYTTTFTGDISLGRNVNILTAADKINDYVLYPGEVFSTNATFGAMTYDNGYRMAPVIIGGELIDDMGGGVCQVSSTLYMAILYAELEIVERQNHSQKVGYMDYAMDATLAGDYIDFKFRNDTDYPVFVESVISGNKLTVNIYGYEIHAPGRRLEFVNSHIDTIAAPAETVKEDPSLPLGERVVDTSALSGQIYELYKIVYENNAQISKEKVNTSKYKPRGAIVRVGTGEASPDSPVEPEEPGSDNAVPTGDTPVETIETSAPDVAEPVIIDNPGESDDPVIDD